MNYKKELIKQIKAELDFQNKENETKDDAYRRASEFHTKYVQELNELADKYPNFIDVLLQQHIDEEEKVFGVETHEFDLSDHEKGRIYSLVRCKHMLRVAKEETL